MAKSRKHGQRLLEISERLPAAQAQALLDYAEFLLDRYGVEHHDTEPVVIPRPSNETVVGAIKRLRSSYPMLDVAQLLNETSALMSDHALRGREAMEVIDELEQVFRRHYERLLGEREG